MLQHTFIHRQKPGGAVTRVGLWLLLLLQAVGLLACSDVLVVKSNARLEVAPTALLFPDTRIGKESLLTFTLYEVSGQGSTTIRALSLEGAQPAAFSVVDFVETDLGRSKDVTFTVRFSPTARGALAAQLQVVAENVLGDPLLLTLQGFGLGEDADGDGVSTDEGDCDDNSPVASPASTELCDGKDNDCNGTIDDDASDASTFYHDVDGDGFGGDEAVAACSAPSGYTTDATDCNDTDATIHPGAEELCDGQDQNCNGQVDEGPTDPLIFYPDADKDGHGDPVQPTFACSAPNGYVESADDCDDTEASIHPGAIETCNRLDDDCNGQIDDNVPNLPAWYLDSDGDGYGQADAPVYACEAPGRTLAAGDCDDTNAAIHPNATELCNDRDEDCDGIADDGVPTSAWYPDADHDGHGATVAPVMDCAAPIGLIASHDDCNDSVAGIHPGAMELCDGIDQDCDNKIDDGLPTSHYYPDLDQDKYGNPASPVDACAAPAGLILTAGDCDDALNTVHPGADEHCNDRDDDCDGSVDEGALDARTVYKDVDQDGFGGNQTLSSCSTPAGYSPVGGDCNDAQATIYPGADEYCNDLDDDCDGTVDEDAVDALAWAEDADGDGYGDGPLIMSCEAADGQVLVDADHPADCDDTDAAYHPDATETCDGEDYNCDGDWAPKSCPGCHVGPDPSTSLYRTVQEALNMAAAGEDFGGEVRVCPATYVENLRFYGAPVILKATDPAHTVIDGSQCKRGQSQCSVVSFLDGEGPASGMSGFTLIGGRGTTRSLVLTSAGATPIGGGVLAINASPTLSDVTISSTLSREGVGIYASNADLSLTRVSLSNQGQGQNGGGLFANGGSLVATNVTLSGQHVDGLGGGLYLQDLHPATLDHVTVRSAGAALLGGGIYAKDSQVSALSLVIEDNSANAQAGGGMFVEGGSFTLRDSSFSRNKVAGGTETDGGGGLLIRGMSSAVVQNVSFDSNISQGNGGGLAVVNVGSVQLTGLILDSNSAATYGGGLMLYGSDSTSVSLSESDFALNTARYGAGLFSNGVVLTGLHLSMIQNQSSEFGGGAYLRRSILDLRNNVLNGNQGRQGAGFYLEDSSGQVLNHTFERNAAREKSSGLTVLSSLSSVALPTIQNNIFSRGTDGNFDVGVEGPAALAQTFLYNDLFENAAGGFTPASSNLALDPLFKASSATDPYSSDLTLKAGSPCKNVGNPDARYNDPDGTRNDLGIYGGPQSL